jgi:radical SAM-linked protein
LDAWDEHINKEAWQTAIASMPTDVEQKIFTERSTDEALGWDSVSLGVSTAYLKREWTLAKESLLTKRCLPNCSWPCGVCGTKHHVAEAATPANQPTKEKSEPPKPPSYPVLFCYEKKGRGIFISHINVMRLFEQAFQRSGIDVAFTQGFNPKPKMEFVNPLTTGASGLAELVLVDIHMDSPLDQEKTLQALNAAVSDGFVFTQMRVINTERRTTVSKHMGGSVYQISDVTNDALITILDEASKAHHSDTMLTKTAQGTYTLISKGEKNPIKALFGSHYDKFQLLAELRLQRIMIYTGDYRQNQALFNHPLI